LPETVLVSPSRVKIAATSGEAALVPSAFSNALDAHMTIPSDVPPDAKAAAAATSAVARFAQPVPVSTLLCQLGIANSVLHPLVVMSWLPTPYDPSSHTASV
jgi:hypothetical protein